MTTTKISFHMDMLNILDEAISDPRNAKTVFNKLSAFWGKHGTLYHQRNFKRREKIETSRRIEKIRKTLRSRYPSEGGSSYGLQAFQSAIVSNKSAARFPRHSEAIEEVYLHGIRSCSEMAEHGSKFELAVVTDQQALRHFDDPEKNCKHCEDVEVVSWKYLSDSCAIENIEAQVKAEEMLDGLARPVPLNKNPRERWDVFFKEFARSATDIIIVDYFIGYNRYTPRDAKALEDFLIFLNDDFRHNTNANSEITILTTCNANHVDIFESTIMPAILRELRRLQKVTVYLFDHNDDDLDPADRFPRERWVGFGGHRLRCHGIDFLSKARPGDDVTTFAPASKRSHEYRDDEKNLRTKVLGRFLHCFQLP